MELICKAKIKKWLSEKNLLDSRGEISFSGFVKSSYPIPIDSGKKTSLSQIIALFFDTNDESLLWINEFGIWPSSEDWTLFNGFRKSLGENRPLSDKPGHIFNKSDLDYVGSIIAMILYFCWGAVIVPKNSDIIIRITHDEFIEIFLKNEKTHSPELLQKLNSLKKCTLNQNKDS